MNNNRPLPLARTMFAELLRAKGITESTRQVQIDLDRDLPDHCRYVDLLLARSLAKGRCAKLLRNCMVAYAAEIVQEVDGQRYLFEPHAICQTIRVLEGLESRDVTKGAFRYEEGPLAGLYKKHFFQASFFFQNILLEMEREGPAIPFRKLTEHYGGKSYMGKPLSETDATLIAQAFSHDTVQRRADRRAKGPDGGLTGEHLIYAVTPLGNRYLYVSLHGEDPTRIAECVRVSLHDFPELAEVAPVFGTES